MRVARTLHALGHRDRSRVVHDADDGAPHVRAADEAVRSGRRPRRVLPRRRARSLAPPRDAAPTPSTRATASCRENAALRARRAPPRARRSSARRPRRSSCSATRSRREGGARARRASPSSRAPTGDATPRSSRVGAEHGYPLIVKAVGGRRRERDARRARRGRSSPDALDAARREAQRRFGDDRVFVERYLERPRHIEVQVLADAPRHRASHLGERECSLQRRHQKVIEEAPSPAVGAALRDALGEAAVALARGGRLRGRRHRRVHRRRRRPRASSSWR